MSRHAWRRSTRARAVTTAAIVLLACPLHLQAQAASPSAVVARPGEMIRVRTGEWEYTGTLARVSGDTAVIRFTADSALVPRASMRRIQVQRGTRRSTSRILIGGTIGLLVGAAVGGYTGVLVGCGNSCGSDEVAGVIGFLSGASVGAVVGGVTGGVIGGRKRYPRWIPAVLP